MRALIAAFAFTPGLLTAQAQPDSTRNTVTCSMANGDRLSGRFVSFRDSRLTLINKYTGRTIVLRDDISFCQTPDSTVRYSIATLLLPKDPHIALPLPAQNIVAPPPPPAPRAPMPVVPLRPTMSVVQSNSQLPMIHEHLGWGRVVNVNYAYSQGNSNSADASFAGAALYVQRRSRFTVQAAVRRAHSDGTSTAQNFQSLLRLDRAIGPTPKQGAAPSLFEEIGYEHDLLAKLDHRFLANTGVSLPLISGGEGEVALDLGIGATHEQYSTGVNHTKGGAVVRLASRRRMFAGATTTQQVTALPDLDRTGRYRVNGNATVAAPLSRALSLRVTLNNRYDTRPQFAVRKNDFTIQSGVGVEF